MMIEIMHCYYGYSLIEILIALAIVAILASVAYPTYTHHIMTARRKHAALILLSIAERMENYRTIHGNYRNATVASLNANTDDQPYYKFMIQSNANQHYLLKALPIKSQRNDPCGTLEINELGVKAAFGRDPANCW